MSLCRFPLAPPPNHGRWYQYRLRTLLLVTLITGCCLSWVAVRRQEAKRERENLEPILRAGAIVQADPSGKIVGVQGRLAPGPNLREQEVQWLKGKALTDAEMKYVGNLTELRTLSLEGCRISDVGLKSLPGLTHLETLDLRNTQVTDQGVEDLQRALPNCTVER